MNWWVFTTEANCVCVCVLEYVWVYMYACECVCMCTYIGVTLGYGRGQMPTLRYFFYVRIVFFLATELKRGK